MKKNILTCFLLLAAILVVPVMAHAAPPGTVGEKNFERGTIALRGNGDRQKARKYYGRAAQAFASLIADRAENGKPTRLSRLLMAGMSCYYVGDWQQAVKIMSAAAVNRDAWEASLYAGLALARLNRTENAAAMWKRFPKNTGQRMIAEQLGKQIAALESGSDVQQVADAVEAATLRQFSWNEHSVFHDSLAAKDRCSGQFWWRYAKSRCKDRLPKLN